MARMGEAVVNFDEDLTVRSLEEYAEAEAESRRHRAATELSLPESDARAASTIPPGSKDATGALTDELRGGLWTTVASYVFAGDDAPGAWSAASSATPVVHRVWSSPPIAGDPSHVPDDVRDLIEEWFSIATTGDAYAFIETVLACLPDATQPRFASACNGVLEHGLSDHRFVGRRLMPIASKSDVATIERALTACRSKRLDEAERHLLGSLDRLAYKPEPDPQEAVHEAIRAVQATAFALTRERPLDLGDALDMLEEQGHIDAALKARHGGLFAWVAQNGRRPRLEDARLILVTCAGFVSTLLSRG